MVYPVYHAVYDVFFLILLKSPNVTAWLNIFIAVWLLILIILSLDITDKNKGNKDDRLTSDERFSIVDPSFESIRIGNKRSIF